MNTGREKADWKAAALLVITINANRDPKSKPVKFEDIYPFAKTKKKSQDYIQDMKALKAAWTGGK